MAFTHPVVLQTEEDYIPYPSVHEVEHPLPSRDGCKGRRAAGWVGWVMGGWPEHPSGLWVQVLGREGPFPLILLPQFGGYWIEGTNHQLSGAPESPPTPAPSTRAKLEGNHTAKIYRKHFLGKVRLPPWVLQAWVLGVGEWVGSPWVWVGTVMETS